MLYMINGEDVPDSLERRMAVRSHLSRIQILQNGRLILAGPFPAIDSLGPDRQVSQVA